MYDFELEEYQYFIDDYNNSLNIIKNDKYYICERSVNLYNKNGILKGKYIVTSNYYNFIFNIDDIKYYTKSEYKIITNNGIISGKINKNKPIYKSDYYSKKNIKCLFEKQKIKIIIHKYI